MVRLFSHESRERGATKGARAAYGCEGGGAEPRAFFGLKLNG
jgi:hypothetical protein